MEWVEVDEGADGQRIDNFLSTRLKGVPRSHLYRLLRKGEVRVNRKRIRPEYRLQSGDLVRIPPVRSAAPVAPARPAEGTAQRIRESLLYEDAALLVLDKPSGLAVHGGSGLSFGAIEALRSIYPEHRFLELVHRLDRETSGCLMVAKKRSALRALHEALREGRVEKTYLALVRGAWTGGTRRIDAALRKNVLQSGERVVRVDGDGKSSVSHFEPVARYREATLVRVRLETGRTHQIRVHAAHLGHPLAGDGKYGDETFNRRLRELGLKRLFLHAAALRLQHPQTGEPLELEAPLPPELERVLEKLKR
ncbi:MAG: 23S rRNA pseudouridine(955/2504/2580) synthase RluC [Gammaproteobacteria bacterium]|nr:23S rRNA pseudouridine(955/2504/2580) synthase RluC [Gammaproteobacteria bacterium]